MSDQPDRPSASRPLWWWGPVLVYIAGIFLLSAISHPPDLPAGVTDKWVHSLVYAGLAVVVLRALVRGRWRALSAAQPFGAALLATAYGATDETHQIFVPGRTPDLRDLAADAIGATIAVLVVYVLVRVRRGWSER
jgi:VanZ family protein